MDHDYLPSPEIRFYNRLKNFFRKFETDLSLNRIISIRRVVDYIYSQGFVAGFDILGSMNFGMSQVTSDLDLILYYEEHKLNPHWENRKAEIIQKRVNDYYHNVLKSETERFSIQFVDSINLKRVELSILSENPYCSHLQSFLLYRTICRGINYRILREKEKLLLEKPELMMYLEEYMKDTFRELITNPTSRYSFKKYRERLKYYGKDIPLDIQEMLNFYLDDKLEEI